LLGSWTGNLGPGAQNLPIDASFNSDGTDKISAHLGSPPYPAFYGTWSEAGGVVTITETSADPPLLNCSPAGQQGTYTEAWSADCNTVTITVISDPCVDSMGTPRSTDVSGTVLHRN
jgi:hypothetical protein